MSSPKLTTERSGSIFHRITADDGRPIFTTIGGGHDKPFTADELNDNACRLVACWNACGDIPTEDLERYYNTGGGIDEALEEVSLRYQVEIKRQRDELLDALETLCNRIELEGASPLDWPSYRAARAAIAKATGGEQ